jgi:hypothetical protein
MVETAGLNNRLLQSVAELYNWLDSQLNQHSDLAGVCEVCGKCCDFDAFEHSLFVTPPELMYFTAKLGAENIKPMTGSRCPYNVGGRCTVYEYRFAGCRIFCCKADVDFQDNLSELALRRLKSICAEFQISYHYTDLATALENILKL